MKKSASAPDPIVAMSAARAGKSSVPSARERARRALFDLIFFVPEFRPRGFTRSNEFYETGDERAPWLSERFLYPLLGIEDGRSVLARLRLLASALGLDPVAFHEALEREHARRYRAALTLTFRTEAHGKAFLKRLASERPELRRKIRGYLRRAGDALRRDHSRFSLIDATQDDVVWLKNEKAARRFRGLKALRIDGVSFIEPAAG